MTMKTRKCDRKPKMPLILLFAAMWVAGCNSAKHVPDGQYWLQKNRIKLNTESVMYSKGAVKDNLAHLIVQRPNTYRLRGLYPSKLFAYNIRYKKLHSRPDSLLPKYVERPVIYDSSFAPKSILNMRNYLFNLGYFYAKIKDTVRFTGKKASVTYIINSGTNYLINKQHLDVDDSGIARKVADAMDETVLKKNIAFTYSLLDEERSRITSLIRNSGYYSFSQENIRFEIDTMDKAFFRQVENPFENAINYIIAAKNNRKPTIDIYLIIRTKEDTSNVMYRIDKVNVFPDYGGIADRSDSSMVQKIIDSVVYKYHDIYVHAKVLNDRIFLRPGRLYSLADYDKTIVKLNELGIFQYIRIQLFENKDDTTLSCNIYLNRSKKHDMSADVEVTSGSTYRLGASGGVSFRDKNFAKGANLLSVSLNGGEEYNYNKSDGKTFSDHFIL